MDNNNYSLTPTEFYDDPDANYTNKRFKDFESLFFSKFFPVDKNIKILDLGCGYGLFLDFCRKRGYLNIEGVEKVSKFVNYARNKLKLINVYEGDIFEYLNAKTPSSYDMISMINVLEHIKKDRVRELFDLIYSRLKPGGIFFAEVPNADSVHGLHTLFSDLTHEFAYTKLLLSQLFKLHGFVNVEVYPNRIRVNKLIRLAQKLLTKIISGDNQLMYSANIIAIARKHP